jgi:hypothetical protein
LPTHVPKAVKALVEKARNGDLTVRAQTRTAYLVRVARLTAGGDPFEDESPECEAGAMLSAEAEFNLYALKVMYEAAHRDPKK